MNQKLVALFDNLNKILIGKDDKIKQIVATFLTGGHVLLEDMPGVGKTIVSKALSLLISDSDGQPIKFARVQGTPDLLPYDITGVDIYDASTGKFTFNEGPIFTNVLLADELNRATPKVQSALLQAMAEKIVTVGNKTYKLPENFFVIATQNPIDSEGTFPLPSAQLDRFTSCIEIGYPESHYEYNILTQDKSETKLTSLKPVISTNDILNLQIYIDKVHIDDKLLHAIVNICDQTRHDKNVRLGLSTRAALAMKDMLKAWAFINERDYCIDQDILDLYNIVWTHRIICTPGKITRQAYMDETVHSEIRKIVYRD